MELFSKMSTLHFSIYSENGKLVMYKKASTYITYALYSGSSEINSLCETKVISC